jgi:rhodanese-related sulfurtransferase
MIRKQLLPTVLIVAALLAACGSQSAAPTAVAVSGGQVSVGGGGAYTNITPAQLAEMLKSKEFFFVNTHIPYDGAIEETDAFIAYDVTAQSLRKYPADKSAKIVLYCRSGRMSAIAAQELVNAGYTNVWNLDGGMAAWEQAGYKLVSK